VSQVSGLISRDVIFGKVNLFNQCTNVTDRQPDRQDYYGNTALCTKMHRAVKTAEPIEMPFELWAWVGRSIIFDELQISSWEGTIFGEGDAHCKVYMDCLP